MKLSSNTNICVVRETIAKCYLPGPQPRPRLFQISQKPHPIFYLTIIPRARMGSESIAHEAEGRMGY